MYCICLGVHLRYTQADAVQIYVKFWDTQYNTLELLLQYIKNFP